MNSVFIGGQGMVFSRFHSGGMNLFGNSWVLDCCERNKSLGKGILNVGSKVSLGNI